MFILENYSTAVIFCIITMLCWGSWANTQKLAAGTWRFELFYWDYVIGILLLSLLFAFTLGSTGEGGRGFIDDIKQADTAAMLSAFTGGVVFNLANILLVAAIAVAGMSVAFPVGIGIALVLGVMVNYMDKPEGYALLLFTGVGLITLAIILNAVAYRKKTVTAGSSTSAKGLLLSVAAGLLMGFFYRFVARSMFSDFNLPEQGKMSPYTAMVFFSTGILLSNFIFNTYIMKKSGGGNTSELSGLFQRNIPQSSHRHIGRDNLVHWYVV